MSYLDRPRLHFAGRFQADVPTANNDPAHFDDERFISTYALPTNAENANGSWNPMGTGSFRLKDCRVTALYNQAGRMFDDPLLGGALTDAESRVSAKMVDLDPEQQNVSEIWGLHIELRTASAQPVLAGNFRVSALSDLWRRSRTGRGATAMGGMYQSIMTELKWAKDGGSSFLSDLYKAVGDSSLSIKFNLDGCTSGNDADPTSPDFTWGRIVGTIGAYSRAEPQHFVAGRVLRAADHSRPSAPCILTSARLTLDVGNSLPTDHPGGPLRDLGVLRVALMQANGVPSTIGSFDTTAASLYDETAGILEFDLDPSQTGSAAATPLAILDEQDNALYSERRDGAYLRADDFVFRLYPSVGQETATVRFFATKFGAPAKAVPIRLALDKKSLAGQTPELGTPTDALRFKSPVKTDDKGRASVILTAGAPNIPRGYIDGQVYIITYGWGNDFTIGGTNRINVRVWDIYPSRKRPLTWFDDIGPILRQYANLYPVMRSAVDLSSFHDVVRKKFPISTAMQLPLTDPNSMPVSRDLSPGKRTAVLNWLADPEPKLFEIRDAESLRGLLQAAVQIEHATIPPYLTALFSLKLVANAEIRAILRGIVRQEMLHLALCCNLLNAVGGTPSMTRASFVPPYPAHLPAGVLPDLIVSVRPFSIEQVRDVFMAIEAPSTFVDNAQPDHRSIADLESLRSATSGDGVDGLDSVRRSALRDHFTSVNQEDYTVGWFYRQLAQGIIRLAQSDKFFSGNPARQLTAEHWPGAPGRLYKVVDIDTALLAIYEIIREGEGTSHVNPVGDDGELAHYYRFKEIVEGRFLTRSASGKWSFSGPTIPFDPGGVYPVTNDIEPVVPSNRSALVASQIFDRSYAGLLGTLEHVFGGSPDRLPGAIGMMFSLQIQAAKLMQIPVASDPSVTARPLFQVGEFLADPKVRLRKLLGREKSGIDG